MRTKIVGSSLLIFAALISALPSQKAVAISHCPRAEVRHSTLAEANVFKDVDYYKFMPDRKRAVVNLNPQPTFPLKGETPVLDGVADLDDFRACYSGCRSFGGGVLQCTVICAPVIVRNDPGT